MPQMIEKVINRLKNLLDRMFYGKFILHIECGKITRIEIHETIKDL